MPPGRKSLLWVVRVKPRGPHHFATCFGSVQASHTALTGASYVRVIRISLDLFFATIFLSLRGSLGRDSFQVRVEAVETLFPKNSVLFHPVGHVPERISVEPAGTPLGFPG